MNLRDRRKLENTRAKLKKLEDRYNALQAEIPEKAQKKFASGRLFR